MTNQTRTQLVTAQIRDLVLTGALSPGARLHEVALAARLAVSRTPVREALGILGAEGLLENTPNCGYVVRRISLQDVLDLFDLRATLEAMACRVMAERGLPVEIVRYLQDHLQAAERLIMTVDWNATCEAEWSRLNSGFHDAVLHATRNMALAEAVKQTRRFPLLHGATSRPQDTARLRQRYGDRVHCQRSLGEHRMVIDAMINRQGARAEHLMREHVYRNREALRMAVETLEREALAA
jgi:GntR family transcriptional regulator of vanillate catabolism